MCRGCSATARASVSLQRASDWPGTPKIRSNEKFSIFRERSDTVVLAGDNCKIAIAAAMRAEGNMNVRSSRFIATCHKCILLDAPRCAQMAQSRSVAELVRVLSRSTLAAPNSHEFGYRL